MKIIKYFILAFGGIVILSSCEENFNPYGEFKESFVFNCIIRCDTTFQMATLDRNYVSGTLSPYDNHEDPSVKGALIKFWYGDSVKIFNYAEAPRPDTSRYDTPYSYYCSDNFSPPEETTLEMEVIMQDGTRLTSYTNTPKSVVISRIESDQRIPPIETDRDYLKMRWALEITNQIYYPVLYITYIKMVNGISTRCIKEVPVNYQRNGNEYVSMYTRASTDIGIIYEMDLVDFAMEQISEGDPNKENYTILAAIFEVLALDDFLSKYYTSTNIANSGFSIKVDETDFSNINGAYGILGSYSKARYALKLTHAYIESFGYNPGLTE